MNDTQEINKINLMNDTQETIQQKLKDYYVDNNEVEYWSLIVALTNIYGKSEKDNTG